MNSEVRVGVFDWGRFARDHDYYPDDLPPDWRMGYYANEFNCACLRLSDFNATPVGFDELVEDLPQDFDLSLLIDKHTSADMLQRLVAVRLHALVSQDELEPWMLANIESWHQASPTATLLSLTELEQAGHSGATCALLPDLGNLRRTRQWVSDWIEASKTNSSPRLNLWLDGASASPHQLNELRLMVELMGY